MAMFSGGYLSKLVLLTTAVGSGRVRDRDGLSQIRFILPCEHESLLRLGTDIGLFVNGESLRLSEFGRIVEMAYLETRSCKVPFRMIIAEYIRRVLPPWSLRFPAGRMETVATLPPDIVSCFHSAGLLDSDLDESIVHWWSAMAAFIRSKLGENKVETGYNGEMLSLQYETKRTGRRPKWISFESNYAGYDLASTMSAECDEVRLIEVKTSKQPLESASFFVSENEWSVAASHLESYHFHLWLLGDRPILVDIPSREIAPHIPQNRDAGLWKSVEIPFSIFFKRQAHL